MSRAPYLRALAVLLHDAGAAVVATGRPVRIAGGVLKLAHRKAARMYDPATGTMRAVPASSRLVWRGPRVVRGAAKGRTPSEQRAVRGES